MGFYSSKKSRSGSTQELSYSSEGSLEVLQQLKKQGYAVRGYIPDTELQKEKSPLPRQRQRTR